jgi:hypothetical protein
MSIQERWDATFAKMDRSCPARRADESSTDYLRRLSRIGRRYIPAGEPIAKVRFDHTLPDEAVGRFSEEMRQCVERNLVRTDNMEPGTFRAVMKVDEQTGLKTREFYGPRTFCDQFMGRVQRVTRINAPPQQALWENRNARAESRGLW